MALLPRESSSPYDSTEFTHSFSSDDSVDDETSDCPDRDNTPEHYFSQCIVGNKMTQRIAAKFKLLEKTLQQDQSTQDEHVCICDMDELRGDMAIWMAICQKRESPAKFTEKVERRLRRSTTISFEEKIKIDTSKAKARSTASPGQLLPPPLTQAALDEAYTQISPGAEKSIKSVIQWWRTNKISADDVLATVKSFTGSSTVLHKIFVTAASDTAGPRHGSGSRVARPGIEGTVVSDEQMRELCSSASSQALASH